MKDDYATNFPYLAYAFLVARFYFWSLGVKGYIAYTVYVWLIDFLDFYGAMVDELIEDQQSIHDVHADYINYCETALRGLSPWHCGKTSCKVIIWRTHPLLQLLGPDSGRHPGCQGRQGMSSSRPTSYGTSNELGLEQCILVVTYHANIYQCSAKTGFYRLAEICVTMLWPSIFAFVCHDRMLVVRVVADGCLVGGGVFTR